jgi:hypothetical protein
VVYTRPLTAAHDHQPEVLDLVGLADFLTPELHRGGGAHEAAVEIVEWAEGDVALLAEAEGVARVEHHEESAKILHLAHAVATTA